MDLPLKYHDILDTQRTKFEEVCESKNWKKIGSSKGVDIFKKEHPSSKYNLFKSETYVESADCRTFFDFSFCAFDKEDLKEIKKRNKRTMYYKTLSEYENNQKCARTRLCQTVIDTQSYVVSNREFVYLRHSNVTEDRCTVLMVSIDEDDGIPLVHKKNVRGRMYVFSIYEQHNSGVKQTTLTWIDPKGYLPSYLYNKLAADYESLSYPREVFQQRKKDKMLDNENVSSVN